VNLRDLQYLIAVYELRNFSKAAERCFVSQPTLSGQLKKLEEELGAPLMERTTRQVIFTRLGEQIVLKAREIALGVNDIKALAQSSQGQMTGQFHIGLIPTVGPFLLPLLMPELTKALPAMEVFLYELQTDVLLKKLAIGELDAIVLAKIDWPSHYHEINLYSESMLLALPEGHDLSSNSAAELSMLQDQSVLMLEDGHCLRDQALGVCFSAGADEDSRFQATSMDTLLHMVQAGIGITLIPELAARVGKLNIRYLRFKNPQPSRDIVLLTRKESSRIPVCDEIAQQIKHVVSLAG